MMAPHVVLHITAFVILAIVRPIPSASAQQTKGTARIGGTVTSAETGQPIRRAAVRLVSADKLPNENTTTDANGRYEFRELTPGRYTVTASRGGYISSSFGETSAGGDAARIELAAGQRVDTADIRLARGGVLTGRVFDEFGDPVPEAQIQVYRSQYTQGLRRLVVAKAVPSNDLGEFRVYGLPTGTYYVSGKTAPGAGSNLVDFWRASAGTTVFAATFYPGTPIATDARPLPIEAGQHLANLDFGLHPARLARISGRVVDSRGAVLPVTSVNMIHARRDGVVVATISGTRTGTSGEFTFGGLAPGDYRMLVSSAIDAAAGPRKDAGEREFASVVVSVAGEDIEGLTIATAPGRTLSGRIITEGGVLDAPSLQRLSIDASDVHGATAGAGVPVSNVAAVRPDGTFEARGLFGPRLLRVTGLPDGWALKSVRVDGRDVIDAGVEVRSDIADIDVVVTGNPSTVMGIVLDSGGRAVADRTVIVFPADSDRWSGYLNRYVATARTNPDGTFSAGALPPGGYLAAVVIPAKDAEWLAPESLERLRSTATSFTLADGEKKSLTLKRP